MPPFPPNSGKLETRHHQPEGGSSKPTTEPGSAPARGRARRSTVDVTDETERPDWLPVGWTFQAYKRINSGTTDMYYIEPGTNHRFRSKKEARGYIDTGVLPLKPKKKSTQSAFDPDDVPQSVKWNLTVNFELSITPFINGEAVPDTTMRAWGEKMHQRAFQNYEEEQAEIIQKLRDQGLD